MPQEAKMAMYRPEQGTLSDGPFQLLRGIFHDAKTLVSKELLAAKLEIKQEIAEARSAFISFFVAGLLLAIGVIMLSLMVVFLLVAFAGWPLWAGLGFVGFVYCVIGGAVLWAGKEKAGGVEPIPKKSLAGAREDVEFLKESVTH